MRYLLIVGKNRDSRTFSAGQINEICGKKFLGRCPCPVSV